MGLKIVIENYKLIGADELSLIHQRLHLFRIAMNATNIYGTFNHVFLMSYHSNKNSAVKNIDY